MTDDKTLNELDEALRTVEAMFPGIWCVTLGSGFQRCTAIQAEDTEGRMLPICDVEPDWMLEKNHDRYKTLGDNARIAKLRLLEKIGNHARELIDEVRRLRDWQKRAVNNLTALNWSCMDPRCRQRRCQPCGDRMKLIAEAEGE